ncbi:MAG: cation transporter, partial [Rhodoglobus sp.]
MSTIDNTHNDLGLTDKNAGGCGCGHGEGGCACGHGEGAAKHDHVASHEHAASHEHTASADQFQSEYLVSGMTCNHCVSSVTEEISELAGVDGVQIELNVGGASKVTVGSQVALDT